MRLHKLSVILLSIAFALVMGACVRRPKGVLSDKEMASVVADLKLAEAYLQNQSPVNVSANRDRLMEYVMEKHGLTREQFDSTMSWYGRNVDAYYAMCDLADKELAKKKKKVAGATSVEIETSDLWPYQRQAYLSTLSGSDALEFSLPTSEVSKGDRINLKFRINNSTSGNAILGVEYEDGEKSYFSRVLSNVKRLDLTLQTDTGKSVSRIFGNFLLSDSYSLPVWLDSIYLQVLPFDSTQYYIINTNRKYREPKARRKPKIETLKADNDTSDNKMSDNNTSKNLNPYPATIRVVNPVAKPITPTY